jgi:hypothetical protein
MSNTKLVVFLGEPEEFVIKQLVEPLGRMLD